MKTKDRRHISRRGFLKTVAASTAFLAVNRIPFATLSAQALDRKAFPVVVIGGGLGGLSAAAIFARNGFPVTPVEQHDRPGGYATSFEKDGGRFNFDVSLHATGPIQDGPMRQILQDTGILGKVEMVELPELCRIITPDHDFTWPQKDPDAIIKQLCGLFPDQAKGIRGFFGEINGVLDEAMKPMDPDSWWDRLLFPITHSTMWGIRNKTLADVLNQYVEDPKARPLLSAFWGYYGLPPSRLSAFYYAIATAAYMRFGGCYVKRRSQDLSYALMDAVGAAGGQVLLQTEATEITVDGGGVPASGSETAGSCRPGPSSPMPASPGP